MSGKGRTGISYFGRVFLIILVLVLTCCSVSMFSALHILTDYAEQQIVDECATGVSSVSETISVMADSFKRDALHLSMLLAQTTDGNMDKALFTGSNPENIFFKRNLYSTLMRLVRANSYFSSIYLYLEAPDYVISSSSEYAYSAEFSDREWLQRYQDGGYTGEMWMGVRTINDKKFGATPQRVMTYVYPLSTYIAPNTRGLVVFNILESEMLSLIQSAEDDRFAIISRQGEIILDGLGTEPSMNVSILPEMLGVMQESGSTTGIMNGSEVVISYKRLNIWKDWFFVRISDVRALYALMNKSIGILTGTMISVLLVSVLLVWVLAKRLSRPITRLREQLEEDERFRAADPDDISRIEKALSYLQKEESRLLHESMKRSHLRRQRYIAGLFLYEILPANVEEDEQVIQLCEERDNLTLYLSDDEGASTLRQHSRDEVAQYVSLLTQMCIDALRDEQTEFSTLTVTEYGDAVIVLHSVPDWTSDRLAALREKLQRFSDNLSESLGFSTTIGISTPWRDTENARTSFVEAREAARMKLLLGFRRIISFDEVPGKAEQFYYPTRQEKLVFTAIERGDREQAREAMHRFIDCLRKKSDLSVDDVMLVLHLFTGALVRELNEEGMRNGVVLPEAIRILDLVYFESLNTLDEVEAFLVGQVDGILERLRHKTIAQTDSTVDRIKAYVDENYTRDLSIEQIASYFDISYSYTRKVFKDATGRNILDYITEKRVEHAKMLLRDSQMNMRDVAAAVGFNSEQTLLRCFKKHENMLPSHYRNTARNTPEV